jgi:hypothetical protein
MSNEERKILEVRSDSGELLLKLRVIVKNESVPEQQKKSESRVEKKGGNGNNGNGGPQEFMTDAQKRYLFRLLAGEGIEGEAAYDELKKAFGVDDLKKVTKQEASQEIERRLAGQKGGDSHAQA